METVKTKVWDYGPGKRFWGHDYFISRRSEDGKQLKISGFGRGIKAGEYILLEHSNHVDIVAFRIEDIYYETDPRDMFWANLVWDGTTYNAKVEAGELEMGRYGWL